jgi:hypothetical protein
MTPPVLHDFLWDRMVRAVEMVRERLLRATAALEQAGVPYAVIGGNAVAAWVARVDPSAVRNTPNVDIQLRRPDLPAGRAALEKAGLVYCHLNLFLDKPDGKTRSAVHVLCAQEKVRPEYLLPMPNVTETELGPTYRIVSLNSLVRMKLNSYRIIDRVHLRDLAEVGLIDASWLTRLPPELAARLKELLETPDG